jgi:hypothetical protein
MRKIKISILILKIILLISSCSTSSSVVSNKFLQKRKYNTGFHFSKKQKIKESKNVHVNSSSIDSERITKISEHKKENATVSLIENKINLKPTKLITKKESIKKPKVEYNFRKSIVTNPIKKSKKSSKKAKKKFVKPLNFSNTLNFKRKNTNTKQSQNKIDKEIYIVIIIVITLTFLIIFPIETLMILITILFYGLIFIYFKNLFNGTLPTSDEDKKCINPGKVINDYMDLW